MFKKYLAVSLCLLAAAPESLFAHPSDKDKTRGGTTKLSCKHGHVERAGVALVKDYGSTTTIPALRFAVIVGADRGRTHTVAKTGKIIDYVNFFGGNCESNDKYSTVTAAEELYEETGKAIDIPANALQAGKNVNYHGYAYSGDFAQTNTQGKNYNQLFFYRKDDASVSTITKAMETANNNPNLSRRFKENKMAYAIPLQDILDTARTISLLEANGRYADAQKDSNYVFQTRGKGDGTGRTDVYLDPQYMRNLARDITRDGNNLIGICQRISGGIVQ